MSTYDRALSSASSLSPSPSMSPSFGELGEEEATNSLFVAVSREVEDTKSVLLWAIENRGESPICLLHVHQPDKLIPTELGMLPIQMANKIQIAAHRVVERGKLSKKLDKHLQFCLKHGVRAGKIYVEMDSIQEGIVKLITDKRIGNLVMGAASDRRYTRNMIENTSQKAKYVREHAPGYCHIWFVCKKLLIHTREATQIHDTPDPVKLEVHERLGPAPEEIGGLLNMDPWSSFGRDRAAYEYKIPMFDRNFSHSTYHSTASGPSAPDLTYPHIITDEQKGIDAWLSAQQRQNPYDLDKPREAETRHLEDVEECKTSEELQSHISSLESRIVKSVLTVEKLEQRLESAAEEVESYKKERDVMQMERDDAIKQVEEVRKQLTEGASCIDFPVFCSELPFQEIQKATNKFDPSLKIEDDANGIIYKGFFHFTVSVKVPHPTSSSAQEYHQEVEIMSKLRHPNIVNLIAINPVSQALIYEYFDRNLDNKLSSMTWQTRTRIAIELCNTLIYLHSNKPHPIVHGDLRPENIHLDSKNTSKLNLQNNMIRPNGTDPRAIRYAYTDPEFFATGELTTKSDVYSYGIILLRLLTGKPAVRLTRQVQVAVDNDQLGDLLDPLAGWPLEQAKELGELALRCCKMSSENRADLEQDVWLVLESMKGLCE